MKTTIQSALNNSVRYTFLPILWFLLFLNYAGAQCDYGFLIDECKDYLQNYTYIDEFNIFIHQNNLQEERPYVLLAGTKYLFSLCDDGVGDSHLKLEIIDAAQNVVASNVNQGKHYKTMAYQCKSTGMYSFRHSFPGTSRGCGLMILKFDKNN